MGSALRLFASRYAWLSLLSLSSLAHPWLQRALVLAWTVEMGRAVARRAGHGRPIGVLTAATVSQLPGLVLACASAAFALRGETSEWASGLLEIWYHPFVCVLELLPARAVWAWSDLFLCVCLLPFGFIAGAAGLLWFTRRCLRHRAGIF